MNAIPNVSRLRLFLAFFAIYIFWGCTFLAMRFGIQTIPSLLLAGLRQFLAGLILYSWLRLRGAPTPTTTHWRAAVLIGALMLVIGNGGVTWSIQLVPSGIAALIIGATPLWIALLDWITGGARPRWNTALGLLLGFTGIILLIGPVPLSGIGSPPSAGVHPLGAAVLLVASLGWSIGTLYSRRAQLPSSLLLSTAMGMLSGGIILLILSAASGEWSRFHLSAVSARSLLGLLFLVIFGSLLGFSAYQWLLRVSTPARVSTYAYVNPVVALALGWAVAGEPLTARTLTAAAVIVISLILVLNPVRFVTAARKPEPAPPCPGEV